MAAHNGASQVALRLEPNILSSTFSKPTNTILMMKMTGEATQTLGGDAMTVGFGTL